MGRSPRRWVVLAVRRIAGTSMARSESSPADEERSRKPERPMNAVPRGASRVTWLIVAIGVIAAAGCGRGGPPPKGTRIATIEAGGPAGGYLDALALAPCAGLAATGSRSGQIAVWSTAAADKPPATLGDHRQAIADLAFSPDGRLL